MPEAAPGGTVANAVEANPLVESILSLQFPWKVYWESVAAIGAARPGAGVQEPPELLKVRQRRAELLTLSSDELQRLHAELKAEEKRQDAVRAAAAEASRFYNQPQAEANFAFWLKVDFWTFDDAIALLLGKNPRVVTWDAVNQAVNPKGFFKGPPMRSQFLTGYMTLRDLALRSDVMTSGPRLRPVDVATWAMRRLGLQLREPLRALVSAAEQRQSDLPTPEKPVPAHTGTDTRAPIETTVVHSTKALRRDAITPVIEEAQAACRSDPYDVAAVWAILLVMAERKIPPLIGATEDGLQYLDQGQAAILNRKALAKRLARAKGRG